jgi:hypothetical protein
MILLQVSMFSCITINHKLLQIFNFINEFNLIIFDDALSDI